MDTTRFTYRNYNCKECNATVGAEGLLEEAIDKDTGDPYVILALKCGHEQKFFTVFKDMDVTPLFKKEHYLRQVKKCVAFIYAKNSEGKLDAIGTGFFLAAKFKGKDSIFFATAKHVLLKDNVNFYTEVYIRLNKRNNGIDYIPVSFTNSELLTHQDADVDIALFQFLPSSSIYDYLSIPIDDLLATKETVNRKMVEGDQVFYAGLFQEYPGEGKNYPILRFGRVSLLTDEKIRVNQYLEQEQRAHIYMFEIQSFAGNSGSPVFFEVPMVRRDKKDLSSGVVEIYFVGIMKGHYNDVRMTTVVDIKDNVLRQLNNGIAMVTPAYLLHEILISSETARK